ncbi:MAG: SAM-dependent methyltransferase [Candidatus Rokuibacteriota bacterium]|nr:MAG: SAM-dependent methyltransferase [Candidatus Rokubacteria bacterium]
MTLSPSERRGETSDVKAVNAHWGRQDLDQAILASLAAAGKNIDALTLDDLAPADQFHGGGKPATVRLARLAGLRPGMRVLDVGGGLGGPARTLAAEFGCHVTVIDLTESYVCAGEALTARLGLADQVSHLVGDALAITVDLDGVDVVWTQNSGMNIADKERLYAGFSRVLRGGGRLATQEPMRGPGGAPIFPVMWARDAAQSFLLAPEEMRALMEAAGFRARVWEDVTTELAPSPGESVPAYSIQRIVMGDGLDEIMRAGQRNRAEGRIVNIQAILDRA